MIENQDKSLSSSAFIPSPQFISTTNIAWLMRRAGVESYAALHAWSVENREAFWGMAIERLGIRFREPFTQVADFSNGFEQPRWLVDAQMNIVDSCFRAPASSPAIVHQAEGGPIQTMTVGELAELTNLVAFNLQRRGYAPGTAIAIIMPMTAASVAIYLGIIKSGCVAVGIADSFQPKEIAHRLHLSNAAAVFTQDFIHRGGRSFPLHAKVAEASKLDAIVVSAKGVLQPSLRANDVAWEKFVEESGPMQSVIRESSETLTILFSSGTTGDPKLIPWTQTTPIKCAVDAHFHQNVHPGDVLVWPTNMGWMMGPWLVFASLLNRATMGLYDGTPIGNEFGLFVERSKATMLGVVPSLVKAWRSTACMTGANWQSIEVFSSTGECSNSDDMQWLMDKAGGKPVIEYCGGTEIGGAYLTGTVTLPCVAGTFNTPALGLDVVILDEHGHPANTGELFIVPPSIGLSNTLLNKDHHQIYYAGVPTGPHGEVLRRHGDQMERLSDGRWRALGRADDTMNLGGIKVSSAEIEQVLQSVPGIVETAAVAVSPGGGPSLLVIYAVRFASSTLDKDAMFRAMQTALKRDLNPLFKIHELVLIDSLPRTASNKVMRRELRDHYVSKA